jgi:hypothetical protein
MTQVAFNMTDFDEKMARINLTFSGYLRRRILELNGAWPDVSELQSTLSRIFTEQFHNSITDRVETSLKLFATLININLMKYEHDDPEYDLIDFIEYAEKYVRGELKTARRWCPSLVNVE